MVPLIKIIHTVDLIVVTVDFFYSTVDLTTWYRRFIEMLPLIHECCTVDFIINSTVGFLNSGTVTLNQRYRYFESAIQLLLINGTAV